MRPSSLSTLSMALAAGALLQAQETSAWTTTSSLSHQNPPYRITTQQQARSTSPLFMYPRRDAKSMIPDSDMMSMNAVAVDSERYESRRSSRRSSEIADPIQSRQSSTSMMEWWMPVLTSSFLITGNTFGAGSLVLPQLAAGPGLGPSSAIFGMAYVLNLMSGLCFANVAIQQYESSKAGQAEDVPSSFKEFVETNLDSPALAVFISLVSFSVNSLVFAFDFSRVGVLFSGMVDPSVSMSLWATLLLPMLMALSPAKMSQAASVCVMVLFATFGSLLIPGLASLTDPMMDWFTPGLAAAESGAFWHSISEITPVIVMSMVFQNIVPSVVKMQGYDRAKSTTAIVGGSMLCLVMYVAWCWACLGQGGIDLAATMSGIDSNPLMTVFSLATLMGSSIGCSLSCASEMDIFVKQATAQDAPQDSQVQEEDDGRFQLFSILATLGLPLAVCFAFSNGGDLIGALQVGGGLGTPLLYGIIPVLMTLKQQERLQEEQPELASNNGGAFQTAGLGVLGVAATGMLCGNVVDIATNLLGPAVLPTAIAATSAIAM